MQPQFEYELHPAFNLNYETSVKQKTACIPQSTLVTTQNVIPRPCCLLIPSVFNSNDNIADPAALGKHNDASEVNGLIYTGKAGFFDLGHVRETCDNTKFIFDKLSSISPVPQTIQTLTSTITFKKCFSDFLAIAKAISFDIGWGHEIVSYWVSMPGGHNSSFSPEDLCSNFMGVHLAELAIKAGGNFNDTVTSELKKLLTYLKAQPSAETFSALKKINGRWIDFTHEGPLSNTYLKRRNFTKLPWKAGHSSDSDTPSFLRVVRNYFTDVYDFVYTEDPAHPVDRKNFAAEIQNIRKDAEKNYGPNFDKP